MRVTSAVALASLALLTACGSPPQPPAAAAPAPSPPPPVVSVTVAAPDAGGPPASPPPAGDILELQRAILASHGALDAVASLSTEVGPRLAGSAGDKLAVPWAIHAMEERGLTNVHAEPVKVHTWQRGVESASIVAPVKQTLSITTLGWSGATPAKGLEGDLVRFDSLDALKAADAKTVAGKIVFLDAKMDRTTKGRGYGDTISARVSGPSVAKTKGAVAFVLRSLSSDASRFPHTGTTAQTDPKTALPAAALSVPDADLIERVLAVHGSARLALNLGPKWLPLSESANVVGEVAGAASPDEVVLLGAHLDSWDLGQGAIDDGAGCGIMLEAARAIGALPKKPRRTVRVVLFAAEENSGDGQKEYARAHAGEMEKIVVAMEADSGGDRALHAKYLGDPDARVRFLTVGPALLPLAVTIVDGTARGGSDISPLRALGVPIVDIEQDATRYFDSHHSANDTFERIDEASIQQAAAAFATAAWTFANMSENFGRVPTQSRDDK